MVPFDPTRDSQAHLLAQMRVNWLPQTTAFPESEVVIGCTPRGKVSRQVAPLTAGPDNIEDCIEQLPQGMLARSAFLAGLGETIIDELPFGVGKIRCISHRKRIADCGTRYKLTLK